MTPDRIWNILAEAAYNPRARNWTVQGFGMLRCYLDNDLSDRLHVWTNALRVQGVSDIHTHPWDFGSMVLAGRLINKRYEEVSPHTEYSSAYFRRLIKPGEATQLEPDQRVWLRPIRDDHVHTNRYYNQKYTEIHRTLFDEGTVSVVSRDRGDLPDTAFTYFRRTWGSAKPRKALPEEVEAAVAVAFKARAAC